MGCLWLAQNKPEPNNFEEFCLAHFGEGISRHFMIPYNTRLWGVHPSEITADWCSRFVPLPRLEDVIAGAVGMNDRELGYNVRFVYPRLGIGEQDRHEVPGGLHPVMHVGGEALEMLLAEHHFPNITIKERPGIPDEARPVIEVTAGGTTIRKMKWSNDTNADFTAIHGRLDAVPNGVFNQGLQQHRRHP